MKMPVLEETVVIFGLSIGVILACHRFKIPPIIGFLITGVLAGPHGFGLISTGDEVAMLAELGVILLLFVIGIELSFSELMRLKKPVFVGGAMQVGVTIAVFAGAAWMGGFSTGQSVFFGFLAALSSTAIVLKLLADRAEMNTPHGRISLGILIFQDIVVVPLMLLVPFLSATGAEGSAAWALTVLALKALTILAALAILAKIVLPRVLFAVVQTKSRELFLMTTLGICFGVALLTQSVGLSLSLGAFLAGLLISESEYSHSALEGILPFRDVFTSVFFVSIGMLLDVGFFMENIGFVVMAVLAVLTVKSVLVTAAGLSIGFPFRVAALSGITLCQVGEFSFVLAGVGLIHGLIGGDEYQLFLAVAIVTMALTPFFIMATPRVSDFLCKRAPGDGPADPNEEINECELLEDHLIVVGFGLGGQHLARAAKMAKVSYHVLEMNPDTVRTYAQAGEPISYGDAAQSAVLEHVHVERARVLAVVIADPAAIRRIVETARALNPGLHIVVRTRFASEIEPLRELGADEVIPEEFETSVEIFNRVLATYLVPRKTIARFTEEIRAEGYGSLRASPDSRQLVEHVGRVEGMADSLEVMALTVEKGSPLEKRTLDGMELRRTHGLTMVAIRRDGTTHANPPAEFRLRAGDICYVFGEHKNLVEKTELFEPVPE